MTARQRLLSFAWIAPLLIGATVGAQESPDDLTAQEFRCEQTMLRASLDPADRIESCIQECKEAQATDFTRFCGPFGFDDLTHLCFDRATLSSRVRTAKRCGADGCPECYGSCDFRLDNELFDTQRQAAFRLDTIACDDTGSPDGLNAQEAKCQTQRLGHTHRLGAKLRQCLVKCHKRRQAGKLTEDDCQPALLDTPEVDPAFQACVDRARVQFLKACFRCSDEPECWSGAPTCSASLEQASQEIFQRTDLLCVDQPICGDGRVSGDEECDFGMFPDGCGADELCGLSCTCEPLPVCGDGQITGFEFCDPAAPDGPCADGFVCRETCTSCAPDRCGNVTALPAEGGTFAGSTSGSSTFTSACDNVSNSSAERVFAWTPATSGTAGLETCGSTPFNTSLNVRTTCNDATTTVACDDDTCGNHAQIRMPVEAGTTYYIVVEAFSGTFRLVVTPPGVYGSPTRAFLDRPASLME